MLKWFRRKKTEQPAEQPVEQPAEEPVAAAPPEQTAAAAETETRSAVEPDVEPASVEPGADEPALVDPATADAEVAEPRTGEDDSALRTPDSALEEAAPRRGFFARLRDRLARTKTAMVDSIRAAIRLHGKLDEDLLEEVEDILIQSDVGVPTTRKIVDRMRREARGSGDADAVLACFKSAIAEILTAHNRPLAFDGPAPRILLFVGVNGAGKTTTIGKIGRDLALQGKKIMMVAADTFRAAAADQLQIWAERSGAAIVRQDEGADPAAVVFEALEGAKEETPDVILIDTAGRLHTKVNLMEQLKKIRRVVARHYPDAPHETILVLDATTGQNAINQLKTFNEATELTGLIMTKLDGTAKGGILVACKDAHELPIYKIGIGEQAEDLRDFIPADFVEALFSVTANAGEGKD
jgi:fused signal recognition particle receptor